MDTAVVSSMGIHSDLDGLPVDEAKEAARTVNEAWADAQRRHPGKFFAAAAIPLQDADAAIAELEHAVERLGLVGISLPGSIDGEPLDTAGLEPFWARVEQLDVPMLLHPSDGAFLPTMPGYDNRIYLSLGRSWTPAWRSCGSCSTGLSTATRTFGCSTSTRAACSRTPPGAWTRTRAAPTWSTSRRRT